MARPVTTSVDYSCVVDGCENLAGSKHAKHQCQAHYAEDLANRIAGLPGRHVEGYKPPKRVRQAVSLTRKYMSKPPCSSPSCDRPQKTVGFCQGHYVRFRKGQDTDSPLTETGPRRDTCTVDGCTRGHKAKGYCDKHYRASRKAA